jgi:hypothetical protein
MIFSNGGHHIGADFKQTQMLNPATLETLRWAADRVTRDRTWVAPGISGVSFANGNVAMGWGNTGAIGSDLLAIGGKFEWEIMPQPKAPKTDRRVATFNQSPNVLTNKPGGGSARIDAAFTLMTFMSGKEVQLLIAKDRGSTPALRELVTVAPYTDAPPGNMAAIGKQLDSVADLRFFPLYADWQNAYGGQLVEIWKGTVSVDAGAQKANDAGNAVLARASK